MTLQVALVYGGIAALVTSGNLREDHLTSNESKFEQLPTKIRLNVESKIIITESPGTKSVDFQRPERSIAPKFVRQLKLCILFAKFKLFGA